MVEASIDNLLNTLKSQKNPFNLDKAGGSPSATAQMGSGLEPLDEKSEVELRSDLESKRNIYNETPGGESELQNFLTEREEHPFGSERVSELKLPEDD